MSARIAAYGRLGGDPRSHETRTGKAMASASLAVTVEARKRSAADELARHSKGEPVSVSGRLRLSRYTMNAGEAREGWQCVADSVVSARSVRSSGGRRSGDDGGQRAAGPAPVPLGGAHDALLDDPIPG